MNVGGGPLGTLNLEARSRVLVVRSGARPFAKGGEDCSVEVIEKVSHWIEPLLRGREALSRPADLAIFTSQIAVERILSDSRLASLFRESLAGGRVVAVGPATARALERRGITANIVASGSAADVLESLPRELSGMRILLPRGVDSKPELPAELARRGAQVAVVELYRKVAEPADPALGKEIVSRPFAAFCVTSPSAGGWLFSGISEAATDRLRRTVAVALGPSTRDFLVGRGVERVEVPRRATFSEATRLLEGLAATGPRA